MQPSQMSGSFGAGHRLINRIAQAGTQIAVSMKATPKDRRWSRRSLCSARISEFGGATRAEIMARSIIFVSSAGSCGARPECECTHSAVQREEVRRLV